MGGRLLSELSDERGGREWSSKRLAVWAKDSPGSWACLKRVRSSAESRRERVSESLGGVVLRGRPAWGRLPPCVFIGNLRRKGGSVNLNICFVNFKLGRTGRVVKGRT